MKDKLPTELEVQRIHDNIELWKSTLIEFKGKVTDIEKDLTPIKFSIQKINTDVEQLRITLSDLREQIKAINVELVQTTKAVTDLKAEVNELKTTIKYTEKDLVSSIEDTKSNFENALAPFKKIGAIITGAIVLALIGAVLSLIIK